MSASVKRCEVWRRLVKDSCGGEAHKQRCRSCHLYCLSHVTCWHNFAIFWLVVLAICVAGGLTYLWLVPYSNAVALLLWPDRPCASFWQMCGSNSGGGGDTTFAAWAVHVTSIDFAIAGGILFGFFLYRHGLERNRSHQKCSRHCCPIVPRNSESGLLCGSLCFLFVAAIATIVLLSIYVGRLIALHAISECAQFQDTIFGFQNFNVGSDPSQCWIYAPSNIWSPTMDPPSGWVPIDVVLDQQSATLCAWCQTAGAVIVAFSIIGGIAIIWTSIFVVFACKTKYNETKVIVFEENKRKAFASVASIESLDIG